MRVGEEIEQAAEGEIVVVPMTKGQAETGSNGKRAFEEIGAGIRWADQIPFGSENAKPFFLRGGNPPFFPLQPTSSSVFLATLPLKTLAAAILSLILLFYLCFSFCSVPQFRRPCPL